jgi:DNA-binding MarR family transcriptional regulator
VQVTCILVKREFVVVRQSSGRQQNLVTLFMRAAHAMTDELVARITAAGFPNLRASHGRLFENLDPQGTRLSELAARAQVTHQSMSELYASLEKAGYVERRPDPADGRAKLVCLTPLGRRMLRFAVGEIAAIETTWFGKMPRAAGTEALRAALHAALRDHLAPPDSPNGVVVGGPDGGRRHAPRRPSQG